MTISSPEMKDAIKRSGYLIEQRVEEILQREGFYPRSNETYPDPITGKTREIDIEASYYNRFSLKRGHINFKIVIECENNPYPVVFFSKEINKHATNYGHLMYSGLPTHYQKKSKKYFYMIEDLMESRELEIVKKIKEATQYCSFNRKNENSKWFATHNEEQHSSFLSLTNFIEHKIREHIRSLEHMIHGRTYNPDFTIYLPILVLEGEILSANLVNGEVVLDPIQSVKYLKEYFFNSRREKYKIYVVSEKHIEAFLDQVKRSFNKISIAFLQNHLAVNEAVKGQIQTYRKENERSKMEFYDYVRYQ